MSDFGTGPIPRARPRAPPAPASPPPQSRDELAADAHQTCWEGTQGHPLKLLSLSCASLFETGILRSCLPYIWRSTREPYARSCYGVLEASISDVNWFSSSFPVFLPLPTQHIFWSPFDLLFPYSTDTTQDCCVLPPLSLFSRLLDHFTNHACTCKTLMRVAPLI